MVLFYETILCSLTNFPCVSSYLQDPDISLVQWLPDVKQAIIMKRKKVPDGTKVKQDKGRRGKEEGGKGNGEQGRAKGKGKGEFPLPFEGQRGRGRRRGSRTKAGGATAEGGTG